MCVCVCVCVCARGKTEREKERERERGRERGRRESTLKISNALNVDSVAFPHCNITRRGSVMIEQGNDVRNGE